MTVRAERGGFAWSVALRRGRVDGWKRRRRDAEAAAREAAWSHGGR